jgi:hypothetical protein
MCVCTLTHKYARIHILAHKHTQKIKRTHMCVQVRANTPYTLNPRPTPTVPHPLSPRLHFFSLFLCVSEQKSIAYHAGPRLYVLFKYSHKYHYSITNGSVLCAHPPHASPNDPSYISPKARLKCFPCGCATSREHQDASHITRASSCSRPFKTCTLYRSSPFQTSRVLFSNHPIGALLSCPPCSCAVAATVGTWPLLCLTFLVPTALHSI